MKQPFIFLLLLSWSPFLIAQSIDSLAIRQVDSLIQISKDLTTKRDYIKALEVDGMALEMARDRFGQESAEYAICCFNHGRVLYFKGNFPESEKWYLDVKMIQEKIFGGKDPQFLATLIGLANLYFRMGQFNKAELFYLETKSIQEETIGKDHPEYTSSLLGLANCYHQKSQYETAELMCLQAKTISEETLGKDHQNYAGSIQNLANVYFRMGQYEKAEKMYLETRDIMEKKLGKDHPVYVGSLHNLANIYSVLGQYERAEIFAMESLAIREKTLGKDHPDYAESLAKLANIYSLLGQYENAKKCYLEAKDIREKTLGKEHPSYANTLEGLVNVFWRMGQYEKSELLDLETKTIREKALGKDHPDYARSLGNLAVLYKDMGQYEKSESYYLESMSIFEKSYGKYHPDFAKNMNNLALLYLELGKFEQSEPHFLESMSIREKTLGKEHPEYVKSLSNLALLYELMGHYESAEPILQELFTGNEHLLERAMLHLSERELDHYLNSFMESQNQILLFTKKFRGHEMTSLSYNNSLFYKGFLLQAAGRIRHIAQKDQSSSDLFNRLKGYQRRLAAQYTRPILDRDSTLVIQLEMQVNDLEKELTRNVAGYGEAMQQVSWNEVQQVLQPGEAAVEFVHFRSHAKDQKDSIHYAALVLLPGQEKPIFISLFEELELVSLFEIQDEQSKYIPYASRGLKPEQNPNFAYLYELVWKPLEESLHGVKKVWFSASGMLHRINLAAIPLDSGAILSDRFDLVALSSTRQLVVPNHDKPLANDAVLIGGVQFDLDSTQLSTPDENLFGMRSISTAWTESGTRQGIWSPLAWTAREVESITTTLFSGGLHTITYTGTGATEEAVKAIGMESPSPRVLHLATHGFFFPDPATKSEKTGMDEREPVFKLSDNAMVRSGLILAGGNYAWQHGHAPKPDMEDGILTAYEISQMDLSNTELVVLSACETGLGDIEGNEGVYGLQRAFKIAGAKYLIMSLWQVPDRETMAFMTTFYRNWLEEKSTIPDAFRKTQLEMRDRFFNPYAWAGFVLVE